jgi:hypothetical protein
MYIWATAFDMYSGSEIKLNGEGLLIMHDDEIFDIIERAGDVADSGSGLQRGK